MTAPLVSVIVPAYNHEAFVEHTLRSIEEQTYPNVETIVVDDGSRDRTGALADAFAARSPRPVRVIHQPNGGIVKALERGLAEARGDYVAFLASDDWITPDKVAFQVADLEATESDAVFGAVVRVVDGQEKLDELPMAFLDTWDPERFIERLVTSHGPMLQSGLFRTSLVQAIGGIDQGFVLEDWPILILAARRARRVRVHPRPFTYYRQHGGNTIARKQREIRDWKLQIIDRYLTGRTRRHAVAAANARLAIDQARERPWASLGNMARSLTFAENWGRLPRYGRRFVQARSRRRKVSVPQN
jgi:glycosyltransferase involved in cell wall biosynthesis